MANNDKFRVGIKNLMTKTKEKTEIFVKQLVDEIDSELVLRSPVDTGRFKANWIIGNGSINTEKFERFSDISHSPFIQSIKVNGQTIYITNSLPYAYRLEYQSWSKQAPAGMTRITVAGINSKANKIGLALRAF